MIYYFLIYRSLECSSWTCIWIFIHYCIGLTDMLLLILGFSFGEYGFVSGHKVIRFVKLIPVVVSKKVWAVCLLVSFSVRLQGMCRLNKPQLVLLVASYGMHNFQSLLIHIQHPYSDIHSFNDVGVGDYYSEVHRTWPGSWYQHSFHYTIWESYKDHTYVDHFSCFPTCFQNPLGATGCRGGYYRCWWHIDGAGSCVLFTWKAYTKVRAMRSEWGRFLTVVWKVYPNGYSSPYICRRDRNTHKVFNSFSNDWHVFDVQSQA